MILEPLKPAAGCKQYRFQRFETPSRRNSHFLEIAPFESAVSAQNSRQSKDAERLEERASHGSRAALTNLLWGGWLKIGFPIVKLTAAAVIYLNDSVLSPILKDMAQAVGEDCFAGIISTTLMDQASKAIEINGEKFIPLDGAVGTAIHIIARKNSFLFTPFLIKFVASGRVRSTKSSYPFVLIHSEIFKDYGLARKREKFLKSSSGKAALIAFLKQPDRASVVELADTPA